MIYGPVILFLLVDLYGTEHKYLEVYNVDTFMNTIRKIDDNARKVENKCYNKNIFNQNIYISLESNIKPNNKDIISIYDMVLQNYKKIIKFEPLSVLTVEIENKNITADHNISQQIFQCYCNIISNLVDCKKTYNFTNRFFNLKYSHKNLTEKKDLLQIMQTSIYTMVIFENCIDNEDDVTLLYKGLKNVANAMEGYLSHLQIVFALKFNNIGEIDGWNKLDINNTFRNSDICRNNIFRYLNLNLGFIKNESSKSKIRCNVLFYKDLFYLITGYRLMKRKDISVRKKDAEMISDEGNNTIIIENATNPCEDTETFTKSVFSGHFYHIQVFDYVKKISFIFVITCSSIKNNIMYYKKCISIYLHGEFDQKLICRYCYIAESSRNSNRVIKLIDGDQKFISFKRNFLLYIGTPFQKFSDYLPFSLTINSSEYLHWYVDDSFYVNHTNLSNTISYDCVIKLTEMLGDSKNDINITFLNASLKSFINQINCDNIYNIFNILTINNKITQNSLTLNNIKEFEIFIIAIKNIKSIYYNSYLIFPIKAYNKLYLISLLNKTWNFFLSRVCLKAGKNNSLQYKTLLHKHVCAKIIFTHYSDNFKELEIDTIIKHIQLEKRIHIYIMLYDSKNILDEKDKNIVRHFLKDYESYNDERHFLRSVKYLTLMLSYSKKKVFIAKVDFYRSIIISFCNTLKEQHNLLTKNKTNMIWYYHTKNSIDVNQYSSLIFDKVNEFFNTYRKN